MGDMATKIVLSDDAPTDAKRFYLANVELEVDPSYETDDLEVLAAAQWHPWLDVVQFEPDKAEPAAEPTKAAAPKPAKTPKENN